MRNRGIKSNILLNSVKKHVNNNPELQLTISQQQKYDSSLNFRMRTPKSMKRLRVSLEQYEKDNFMRKLNDIFSTIKQQVIERNKNVNSESDIQNVAVMNEIQRRSIVMAKYEFKDFYINDSDINVVDDIITYLNEENIIVTDRKKKFEFKEFANPTKEIIIYE